MRKFLGYTFTILISLGLLLYLLDFIYTYTYINGTPRNKVSYILSLTNKKIDYIFIGSSRVDNAIDADIIEYITGKRAINLGIQGGKIDDYYLMLQVLKKQNITAEAIFIQIDYIYNIEGNSEILMSSLMPFIHNDLIYSFIKERDPHYWVLKYIPFYRYLIYDYKIGFREFFNTAFRNKSWINFENGFHPLNGKSGKVLSAHLPDDLREENKEIDEINSFSKSQGSNIVYFIAPFCSGTDNIDFPLKLEKKLPKTYNFSTLFFNYDEYFYDCYHLNTKGAKEFSRIFAETILKNSTL